MKRDTLIPPFEISTDPSPTILIENDPRREEFLTESPISTPHIASAAPAPKISSRLGTLNGLRGLATLGVIFTHSFMVDLVNWRIAPKIELPFGIFPGYLWPLSWLTNSRQSVDLFFVLSGFVLYLPYCTEQRTFAMKDPLDPTSRFSLKIFYKSCMQFYKRRCERLLPLYYCSLLVFILFWVEDPNRIINTGGRPVKSGKQLDILGGDMLKEIAVVGTLTHVAMPNSWQYLFPAVNPPYWSIGYEFWFSIFFPIYVLAFKFASRKLGICGSTIGTFLFMMFWYI